MKKGNFLKKFTIIDIIIIICVIGAIGFAVFHMSFEDSNMSQATSFDSSTNNKILEKYLDYYKDGYIIKSQVVGSNSTNGEKVSISGEVKWIGEFEDNTVKILIDSNGERILTGLYKNVPEADVYYDKISLEIDGDKYSNLKEFKISPEKINSLNELISKIPSNCEYEISTEIAVSSLDIQKYQEMVNKLEENKKASISLTENNQIIEINRADSKDIKLANSALGEFEGQSGEITLRIYNCSESDLKTIDSNYNVVNIRDFS
ncbi:adhesin [uncultured Methanobrevibacter sp.]|uniref:adhesin n=1 Tax=uncultured Methanobrevibacter sp. TaxID=253161 RepID=UPI00262DAC0E